MLYFDIMHIKKVLPIDGQPQCFFVFERPPKLEAAGGFSICLLFTVLHRIIRNSILRKSSHKHPLFYGKRFCHYNKEGENNRY